MKNPANSFSIDPTLVDKIFYQVGACEYQLRKSIKKTSVTSLINKEK